MSHSLQHVKSLYYTFYQADKVLESQDWISFAQHCIPRATRCEYIDEY